ncbi:morphogenetic protein [Yersinia enterocolitica]|uniref:morphogenetic protein n=1 Tax=Yersinia enterocolitica TaxID=630 RepID=UPI001E373A42|nr:morphogenetic protein [Yersinia enterocolitica]MCE3068272.1 morphogenetic protein [Yersinia enterocolitica]MCE3101746.1 morphogenetic protein [Yersinia enterocolitica]UNA05594.1 RNA-binding protein [Yersinia phage vB_YenM_06.16-1]UNA05668.1 virion protein [Yersinia phage vB_YenM_21.09]
MNEKPILFNAEMVNAILSGRKTQTRRIISEKTLHLFGVAAGAGECHPLELCDERSQSYYLEFCPLGKSGDQLWVRETWARYNIDQTSHDMAYRATTPADWPKEGLWRPSIHMPRWASRIDLLITGVRVERLNDISEQDARAEGVKAWRGPAEELVGGKLAFFELWDSIYGQKEGENWQANPWVWVIEFERMEAK